jgi:hypothetical protein
MVACCVIQEHVLTSNFNWRRPEKGILGAFGSQSGLKLDNKDGIKWKNLEEFG